MAKPVTVKLRWNGRRLRVPSEIEQEFDRFSARFQRAFWLFANKELRRECLRYVQRRTPKRTGRLRESIVVEAQQTGSGLKGYAVVGYEEYYALWVAAARKVIDGRPLRNKVRKAFAIAFDKALAAARAARR